jgi:hypothetical protein
VNQMTKVKPGDASAVFASRVLTRTTADMVAAKANATGVFWLALADDPFLFVSEDGEIVSLHHQPGRVLRPSRCGDYLGIKVAGTTRHIHRLVCETFHGPRAGMVVRHLDGDRFNNRLSNLAWGTHEENAADKIGHGTSNHGERNPQAKLTRDAVAQMRLERRSGRTFKAIAQRHGISPMTAHRAITGASWS